jgi:glycerol-3-phosphate dehydrogenase
MTLSDHADSIFSTLSSILFAIINQVMRTRLSLGFRHLDKAHRPFRLVPEVMQLTRQRNGRSFLAKGVTKLRRQRLKSQARIQILMPFI